MLIVRPTGAARASYYWQGCVHAVWLGAASAALGASGELDPDAVDPLALRRLLDGRHPSDRTSFVTRRPRHRRDGWDLVFAAPKSLSLLAAMAPPGAGQRLVEAHRLAVTDTVEWLETRSAWARRDRGRRVRSEVEGVVAAAFTHLANAAGEPHVHTHVVLANLAPTPDGRWRALAGDVVWAARGAIGALYELGLRHHSSQLGWGLRWLLRGDGLADLAGVPRAAVTATSSRRHHALDRQRTSRQPWPLPGPVMTPDWRERAAAAGFGAARAEALCQPTVDAAALPAGSADSHRGDRPGGPVELDAAVASWLDARGSTFDPLDAIVARAVSDRHGDQAGGIASWAERFCAAQLPAPGRRWTTAASRTADDALGTALPSVGALVVRAGRGRPSFVEQAETVHQLADAHAGRPGAALCCAAADAARWQALTGLERWQPPSPLPGLLVVDRADRVTTATLAPLVDLAGLAGTTLVLVEGGSLPALSRARSAALDAVLAEPTSSLDLGAGANLGAEPLSPAAISVGRLTVATSAPAAITALAASWARAGATPGGGVLCGLGLPEAAALNDAARRLLHLAGRLEGPALRAAGRELQAGEEVMVLRGGLAVPAATRGTVVEVDPAGGTAVVELGGARRRLDRRQLGLLGYAYATTPAYLDRLPGAVFLLGEPAELGKAAGRVAAAAVVLGVRQRHRAPTTALERAAVGLCPPTVPLDRPLWALAEAERAAALDLERRLSGSPPDNAWVAANNDRLQRWSALRAARALRADALVRAVEADPPAALGERPGDDGDRLRWHRRAASLAGEGEQVPLLPGGPAMGLGGR